jgi:hypothetical protein
VAVAMTCRFSAIALIPEPATQNHRKPRYAQLLRLRRIDRDHHTNQLTSQLQAFGYTVALTPVA